MYISKFIFGINKRTQEEVPPRVLRRNMFTVVHNTPSWLPQTMTWLYNQIRFLPDTIESHIVCESTENLEQFGLPNIYSFTDETIWHRLLDQGLRKLRVRRHLGLLAVQVKRHQAKILHSHFGHIGWGNRTVARRAGIRHVVTFYGLDVNHLPTKDSRWHNKYRDLFKGIDRILCEGPYMASCVRNLGCPEKKIIVHHLGVPVEDIPFVHRRWDGVSPLKVLIASTFREKKGIPYALAALGKIRNDVEVKITVIGDASSDQQSLNEKQKIIAAIKEHKLEDKVRLLGYQPYSVLLEESLKHHIFLSPSVTADDGDTEGGAPISIIDMLASGMLVVSTEHCDIPEIIVHNHNGLLAKEKDIDGLAENLRWLLNHTDQWEFLSKNGRARVEQEFNARIQGQRLGAIYASLCC